MFAFENTSERPKIALAVLGAAIISVLTGLCCSRGIDLVNAWNGWAPLSYVWAWNDAETFLKLDFLKEQNLHVGNSLAMRIYPLAYGLLGIDPEFTQYIFIYASALLYAASLWLLTSTLFPRVSSLGLWLVIGVALLTEAANGNLAGFGQANLSLGQAYGVAIPLQVTALALVMRGRLLTVGVVLGLLSCVHLTLGVMTTAIVGVMLCWKSIVWRDWRFWTAGSIVGVCTLAWAFGVVDGGGDSYGRMEATAWVLWTRFSNSHWFPFDLGVFTAEHYFRLTPFLALAIIAWCCSATEMTSLSVRRSWIIGLVASTFITIIGLIISLYPVSQSFVMVALHRASGITLLLLLPVAVLCLARFLERGNATTGSIAAMAIASPFFGSYGVPLLPAVALAGFVLYGRQDHGLSLKQRWVVIFLAMAAIGYVLFLVIAGHAHIFDIAFVGRRDAWLTACAFFTVKIVPAIIRRRKSYPEGVPQAVIMMLIVGFLWIGVYRNWNSHPKVPQTEAQAYLDSQKWASDNTTQHALFMPDPAHFYGWKDYSRRASYGNLRDWTHSVIAYRSDALKFKEGIRRARRLGVDPELYLARAVATAKLSPGSAEYAKMYRDIRSAYYQMSGAELLNLAHDEGINYFVFQLKYANLLQLKPVYQNSHFAICEPIPQEYRVIAEQTFSITLPSSPVSCEELLGPQYDWVNRGSRGTIWLNRPDREIGTLRLAAGTPNKKGEHTLLLSPRAESEKGFPVVSGAQVVTFECDMRYIGQKKCGRDILVRFDVFSSKNGWSYHSREIDAGEEWSHFESSISLPSNAVNIYPTLVWTPMSEGCTLELRSARIRWITVVDTISVLKLDYDGKSDS